MNNIVHKELRQAYQKLTIVADELGTTDYMESFCKYVERHQDQANLLGEADFLFEKSNHDAKIQVADFVSGTLARYYDHHKYVEQGSEYLELLQKQIIRIEQYPKNYKNYELKHSATANDYDPDIAQLCFSRAVNYIEKYKDETDELTCARCIVLKYLLFRFMNNDSRGYIATHELIEQIRDKVVEKIDERLFRQQIIGKLRDEQVILASSNRGYKIPAKLKK